MSFINKKFTQLTPIEEIPNEKDVKKENPKKNNQRIQSETKIRSQTAKIKVQNSPKNGNESIDRRQDSGLDARDFLWENNYKTKLKINQYKDDNSKLKAKIGNLEVLFFHIKLKVIIRN